MKTIKRKAKSQRKELTPSESRYRFKEGHAEDLKARSIKKYRAEKGKDFELTGSIVLRALKFLDEEAIMLPVNNQLTAETEIMPVIRLTHAAKLLNVAYQTLWRWYAETQQVPMPVLMDTSQGREYAVYHVEEIRVMIRTIGDHFTRFRYYRADHESTRNKVFAAIEALRATNYKLNGENTNGNPKNRKVARRKKTSRSKGS